MPTIPQNHNGNGASSAAGALIERERRLDRARSAPKAPTTPMSARTRGSSRGTAAAKIVASRDDTGPKAVGAWKAGLLVAALAFGGLAWMAPREDAEAVLETSLRSAPPAELFALERGGNARVAAARVAPAALAGEAQSRSAARAARVSLLAEKDFLGSIASGEAPGQQGSAGSLPASVESRGESAGGDRSAASRAAASARERPVLRDVIRDPGAKRRTSVTVREEAPKPPPPKPSVIVEQPRTLYKPKPAYPASAVKYGTTGFVRVRVLVSAQGTAEKYEILGASPRGVFEDSVKEVIPRWTMVPAKDDAGVKVPCWMEFSFVFELKSGT